MNGINQETVQKLENAGIVSSIQVAQQTPEGVKNTLKGCGITDSNEVERLCGFVSKSVSDNKALYRPYFSEKVVNRILSKSYGNPVALLLLLNSVQDKALPSFVNSNFKYFGRFDAGNVFVKKLTDIVTSMNSSDSKGEIPWHNQALKSLTKESVEIFLRNGYITPFTLLEKDMKVKDLLVKLKNLGIKSKNDVKIVTTYLTNIIDSNWGALISENKKAEIKELSQLFEKKIDDENSNDKGLVKEFDDSVSGIYTLPYAYPNKVSNIQVWICRNATHTFMDNETLICVLREILNEISDIMLFYAREFSPLETRLLLFSIQPTVVWIKAEGEFIETEGIESSYVPRIDELPTFNHKNGTQGYFESYKDALPAVFTGTGVFSENFRGHTSTAFATNVHRVKSMGNAIEQIIDLLPFSDYDIVGTFDTIKLTLQNTTPINNSVLMTETRKIQLLFALYGFYAAFRLSDLPDGVEVSGALRPQVPFCYSVSDQKTLNNMKSTVTALLKLPNTYEFRG